MIIDCACNPIKQKKNHSKYTCSILMYTYMYTRNFHRKLEKKTMGEGENVFLKRGGGHKKK